MTFIRIFISCLSFVSLANATTMAQDNPQPDKSGDGSYTNAIAAIVEDRIITVHQLKQRISPLINQIRLDSITQEEFQKKMEMTTREVLNDMIDRNLIIEEFYDSERVIPESYLQNEFNESLKRRFNDDRSKYIAYLQEEGKTDAQYRRELTDNLIVSVMERQLIQSLAGVSPERIKKYYNENQIRFHQEEAVLLRQITLAPIADANTEVLLQEARSIIQKLEDGADFGQLAMQHNSSNANAESASWVSRKAIRQELEDVAFNLAPGEYSQPIELSGYVFILYVEEKQEEGFKPLAEVREKIQEAIVSQEMREARQKWINKLRKNAFVKYYL